MNKITRREFIQSGTVGISFFFLQNNVVDASFHGSTAHTGTMTNMTVADFGAWGQGKLGKYSFLNDGIDDSISIE